MDKLMIALTLFFLNIGGVIVGFSSWAFFQPLDTVTGIQNAVNLGFGLGFLVLGATMMKQVIEDIWEVYK